MYYPQRFVGNNALLFDQMVLFLSIGQDHFESFTSFFVRLFQNVRQYEMFGSTNCRIVANTFSNISSTKTITV